MIKILFNIIYNKMIINKKASVQEAFLLELKIEIIYSKLMER
jgi:hypothetical protein